MNGVVIEAQLSLREASSAGEKDEYVSRAMRNVAPYLEQEHAAA